MIARLLPWHAASARLAARSRNWALQRQGNDRHTAELHARRIYILPTRAGLTYAMLVMVLLVGSMNYSNNMGFALTFLLAGIGLVAMHHSQRNLSRLRISLLDSEAAFAGQHVSFRLRLENSTTKERWQLHCGQDRHDSKSLDLAAGSTTDVSLPVATTRRGRLHIPRIAISSTFPLGLVRAWSWVHLDATAIVWPQPADHAQAPLTGGSDATGHSLHEGGDDLSGVRDYQVGDSPRRIDWKALARSGELYVREYRDGATSENWLDWDALDHPDPETRLAMLARLAIDAHADGRAFGLRMPEGSLPPDVSEAHLRECLNRLALFNLRESPPAEGE